MGRRALIAACRTLTMVCCVLIANLWALIIIALSRGHRLRDADLDALIMTSETCATMHRGTDHRVRNRDHGSPSVQITYSADHGPLGFERRRDRLAFP